MIDENEQKPPQRHEHRRIKKIYAQSNKQSAKRQKASMHKFYKQLRLLKSKHTNANRMIGVIQGL